MDIATLAVRIVSDGIDQATSSLSSLTSAGQATDRALAQSAASAKQFASASAGASTAGDVLTASQQAMVNAFGSVDRGLAAVNGKLDAYDAALRKSAATQQAATAEDLRRDSAIRQVVAAQEQAIAMDAARASTLRQEIALGQSMADGLARERAMMLAHADAIRMDEAATRSLALAQIRAIEMDIARTESMNAATAATTANSVATAEHDAISHSAVIGIGELTRGLGRIAATGDASAFAIRELSGGTMRLGAALGSMGAFAGIGVLALGALYEMWAKGRHEIEETRKKFEEELAKMANAGETTKLQEQMQRVMYGNPFDDKNKLVAASKYITGAFEGSLADLEAHFDALNAKLPRGATMASGQIVEEYNKVVKQLDVMRERAAETRSAILNVAERPANSAGLLPPSVTTGMSDAARAAHALADAIAEVAARQKEFEALANMYENAGVQAQFFADGTIKATTALERFAALNLSMPGIAEPLKTNAVASLAGQAVAAKLPDQTDPQTQYEQQMEQIWRRGFESIAEHGLQSFTSFFDQVLNLFRRLMDQMQKASKASGIGYQLLGLTSAGIGGGLAGYQIGQQSGDSGIGAIGGAGAGAMLGNSILPGAGAIIGGLAGAAGGLLGAADAQQKAAAAWEAAMEQLQKNIDSFVAAANGGSGLAAALASIDTAATALLNQLHALSAASGFLGPNAVSRGFDVQAATVTASELAQKTQVVNDFISSLGQQLNALSGPAGAYSNSLDDINKKYRDNLDSVRALGLGEAAAAEATDIYRKSIDQLNNSLADAATSTLMSRLFSITGGSQLPGDVNAGLKAALGATTDPQSVAFLNQQIELNDNFSKYLDGLQAQKDAATMAAVAAETQANLTQALLQVQQDALQVNQQALDAAKSALVADRNIETSLQATRDALKLGTLTTLSPAQQLIESKRQFSDLVSKAMTGDQAAAGGLSGAANSYLSASRAYNASGIGYVSDYNTVQAALGAVQDQFGAAADVQQQMVNQLQGVNDKLTAQILLLQAAAASQSNNGVDAIVAQLNNHQLVGLAANNAIAQLSAMGYQTSETNGIFSVAGGGGSSAAAQYAQILAQARAAQGLPGYATGSDYTPSSFIAGERGPELITNRQGSRVYTASQTSSMLGGSGDIVAAVAKLERKFDALVKATDKQTLQIRHSDKSGK
jgi:hypothetical protein